MSGAVKEYTASLFELAAEQQSQREFGDALHLIQKQLEENPDYIELLSYPGISVEVRKDLLSQAFGAVVPEYVLSFVQLLCEKGRMNLFALCVEEYDALYHAMNLISEARVVSALALTEDEKSRLVQKLETLSGHQVQARYEIDPSLLGGVVVYMDDSVLDGSLRKKLKEIKEVISQ